MRLETESRTESCPYCGEPVELVVDPSVPRQEYVEDCYVCCRPIVVSLAVDGDEVALRLRQEDEV